MPDLLKKITEKEMNRQDFLKVSASGAAAMAFIGNGGKLVPAAAKTNADAVVNGEGKWISAACWHNCGGRCVNKALVVDGIVTRQKTDDTHPDSPDFPQQRGCPRGRSQRHQVFGADRIKYPMKRKHWEPGGGDRSRRGRDEWERISWDEALDYVAAELKKAHADYGPRSILVPGWGGESILRLLALKGGGMVTWDVGSYGTYGFDLSKIGLPDIGLRMPKTTDCITINDRIDLRNSETVVMMGMNPAWAGAGSPMYHAMQIKKAGAEFIFVGPDYNLTASSLGAKWIRVRPGTDTAFLLSVVYVMLQEDDPITNPIIDWDFLNRYTVGFDVEHMPEDATTTENLKDYVLGKYDNIPKTPQWAADICGTPVEDIVYFAREIRKDKKVAFMHSYAMARCNGSDNLPQLITAVGAMGGHFGKSGHCTGACYHAFSFNGGSPLVAVGGSGLPAIPNPLHLEAINTPTLWKSILEGKYNCTGNGNYATYAYQPGVEKDLDIHVIFHGESAKLQSSQDIIRGIEVHRKVDFVVSCSHFLTTNSKYADIVLPVTTWWERIGGFIAVKNREATAIYSQVTKPLYEAKDDCWIVSELAKRWDVDPKEVYPIDSKQQFFNQISGCTIVHEDGKTVGPMVTITQADIAEWGVQGEPQQGVIGLKEYQERGVYQVERRPGDNYSFIAYEDFVQDPEKNPLRSKSGKFELYNEWKSDTLNALKYGDPVFKPYPTYVRPAEGFEDTFEDWDNKVKGDYPYQMFTPHYMRRAHTAFDNVKQLQEAFTNPAFISRQDADEKGVKGGDTILIWSRHGKILRHASVTETMMPGCISIPHGTWEDIDEETGIDAGGSANVLSGPVTQGCGVSGYNTCNVNFEKYTGNPIVTDVQKPARIINFS